MLGFIADEPNPLVEGVRFRTDNIASDRDLIESATKCPLLNCFNQPTADTFSAMAIRHDESPDFAVITCFENFVFSGVNPADDLSCLRDKNRMILQLKEPLEPLRHDPRFDRITELSAQSGDRRGVVCSCPSNVQWIHERTLSFFTTAFYNSVRRNAA